MSTPVGTGPSAGSLADVLDRSAAVPPIATFPGVDELVGQLDALVAAHPQLLTRRRIGTSRLGEPLVAYTVAGPGGADGPQHLVVGGVHPNEPIGACTARHLVEQLCTDPALLAALGATWHVVPCIDPDGARLNEGWFAGPFERGHYAREFYRPAPDEQVEWSFPFAHREAYFDAVMPETLALMRLIDDTRPQLMVSLHNGELGGVYYYLSRAVPELVPALHAVPERLGLALDLGEAEMAHAPVHAPAVFGMADGASTYDHFADLGLDAAALVGGASSAEYAGRHGTLSLVAELPYWSHPAASDTRPTDRRYVDVLEEKADALERSGALLADLLARAEPLLTATTPFLRASRAFVPMLAEIAGHERARRARTDPARAATTAEVFSAQDLVRCFQLRYGGMLVRALAAEVGAGTAPAPLRRLHAEAAALQERWQEDAARLEGTELLPFARLVGVQLGATLAAAAVLAGVLTAPGAAG